MDIFQELGFKNEQECELYEDICCEMNIRTDIRTFDDLLRCLEEENIDDIKPHTKKEYETFIKDRELGDLFEKVKTMSLLDRYVELYIYHANYFSIIKNMLILKLMDVNNDKIMYDGESIIEDLQEYKRLSSIMETQACCISYISGKVRSKIPFEEDFFLQSVENIKSKIFVLGNDEGNQPNSD